MKKKILKTKTTKTLLITLLISVFASTLIINLGRANPIAVPIIEVQSPQNKLYNLNKIELIFLAPSIVLPENRSFSSFSYSIDGFREVPIDGNTTITGLSWGSHSVVVYGEDDLGYVESSQTVYFDVIFSTTWIIILIVLLIAILGLWAYFKKLKYHKQKNSLWYLVTNNRSFTVTLILAVISTILAYFWFSNSDIAINAFIFPCLLWIFALSIYLGFKKEQKRNLKQ